MRRKLMNLCDGERHPFTATVAQFGSFLCKETGRYKETVMLADIALMEGQEPRKVTDHVWVTKNGRLQKAEDNGLQPGDRISFMARSGPYPKGHSMDFSLKDLADIRIINENHDAPYITYEKPDGKEFLKKMNTEMETKMDTNEKFKFGEIYQVHAGTLTPFYGCVIETCTDQYNVPCILFFKVSRPERIYHYMPDTVTLVTIGGVNHAINPYQPVMILASDVESETPVYVLGQAEKDALKESMERTMLPAAASEVTPIPITVQAPESDPDDPFAGKSLDYVKGAATAYRQIMQSIIAE